MAKLFLEGLLAQDLGQYLLPHRARRSINCPRRPSRRIRESTRCRPADGAGARTFRGKRTIGVDAEQRGYLACL